MKVSKKAISSKNTKKFLCVLMALVIMLVPMGLAFASADSNTFRVSNSKEFIDAVNEINAGADDEEYAIEMLNDVAISHRVNGGNNANLEFHKGITTIYGNNHALTSNNPSDIVVFLSNNAVVNFGSEDEPEKSKLSVVGRNNGLNGQASLLEIMGSATANIYDGVVFRDNKSVGEPGGAISVGHLTTSTNATLNMYGGIIRNCVDNFSGYGGAVCVGADTTFNMYKGTIENNTSFMYGGGICNLGTFNMYGGLIENNKAITSSTGISYCVGGGVFNAGNFVMEGGVIQNNIANHTGGNPAMADDIYSQGTLDLKVAANAESGFGKLNSTDEQITGWFADGDIRWDAKNYCEEVTTEEASAIEGVCLKAAHFASVKVTFNVNSGVWNDTADKFVKNEDNTYTESFKAGATADIPTEPSKTDYNFLGWFTEDGTLFDFTSEVNEDITLYAKWEYNGYKASVTLDKIYQIADGYKDNGSVIDPQGKLTENITLTIEPYNSFNREVGKTNIPAFAQENYSFTTGINADEIQIALPDFSGFGIGDYWYKVTELEGNTAGVTYDSNEYYMHIVVTHEDELNPDGSGISQITFHKNAPNADGTYTNEASDKATGFTNTYAEGSLSVTTDIKGNFADRTKTFDVDVTFNAPENKTVTGDIYFGDDTVAVEGGWNTSKTVTITLGLGDTISFKNIPDGVTYTVAEKDYSADGYNNPVYNFDNADENGDIANSGTEWNSNIAQGTISDDDDTVTIVNEKNVTIDVGVFLENAPFVALILLVVAVAAVMIITRRRRAIDAE